MDNVTTTDDYTAANTLTMPLPVKLVTIIVSNNPVMAQFAYPDTGGGRYTRDSAPVWDTTERRMLLASWTWEPEDFTDPLTGVERPVVAVRVRSAVTGAPAQVTIHA